MLKKKVKEESLRTYLFTYSHVYDTISLHRLADMYEMEYRHVHSLVAKMIINQELMVGLQHSIKNATLMKLHNIIINQIILGFHG